VVAGEGIVALRSVQLEGKREMSVDEFVRGQRDFIGSVLG
jgi:methionyl-tRNA formyltransferase